MLIKFRFSVASISDCPPDKKAIPGTSLGTEFLRQSKVNFATSSFEIISLDLFPASIILGFKIIPFKSILCKISSSKHFFITSEVPGIAFLSGGQSEIEATENLDLINKNNNTNFIMSYSYGRALQQSALKFWSKNIKDIDGTQKVFNHRAEMNTLAALGKWSKEIENQ